MQSQDSVHRELLLKDWDWYCNVQNLSQMQIKFPYYKNSHMHIVVVCEKRLLVYNTHSFHRNHFASQDYNWRHLLRKLYICIQAREPLRILFMISILRSTGGVCVMVHIMGQ